MNGIYYEDINPGDELPIVEKTITRNQILDYADASGDYNPIHVDEASGKKAGLGGIIAHGLLSLAFMTQLMTDWLADPMDLKKIKVRFVSMVKPGDELRIKGKIKDKYIKEGLNYVDCELISENQNGERATIGQATAILPSKIG
jgi:acyl dehydratase